MYTTSMLLITALLVNGLPETQVLRKANRGQCHGQPTTTMVTQALLQCADELIQNDGEVTAIKLATEF